MPIARAGLALLAAYYLQLAATLLVAPRFFYDNTPGVAMMGPYNAHFVRDVGIAFLASAGAMGWAVLGRWRRLAIFGAAFPAIHGLYHVQVWIGRGLALDRIAAFELAGVVLPGVLALVAAISLEERPE